MEEVCVVGVPDPRLFQEICAWIVTKQDSAIIEESDLKEFCHSVMLNDSLSPKYYIFVSSLPRSMIGKVDRKFLTSQAMIKLGLTHSVT